MSGSNALQPPLAARPVLDPATRYGQPGTPQSLSGPRMPLNALQPPAPGPAVQPPAPAAAAPAQPVGEIAPGTQDAPPLPLSEFPPDQHAGLQQEMGGAFAKPDAASFVHEAYHTVRAAHPQASPRAALLSARDAYHAVQHGFVPDHATAHALLRAHPPHSHYDNGGTK
jgi:hypothetical protein